MAGDADVDAPWARVAPRQGPSAASRAADPLVDRRRLGARPRGPVKANEDIDVAVLRSEHEALREQLADWDLQIAHRRALRPWTGRPVGPPENAVWRGRAQDPWHMDFKIEPVEGDHRLYRRDPAWSAPLAELGTLVDGVPFLAPAVARLYRDGSTKT